MSTQLVEIHPPELKFTFEVKKQSSCSVHLANVSDQYVAFKVKTTSSKKYCVRPNMGIIKPKSTSDFTVTMQAQRSAPIDMQCEDKFLIQSTVVPFGTTEEDITPGLLDKDVEDVNNVKHMEEPRPAKVGKDKEFCSAKDAEFGTAKDVEPRPVKDVEGTKLKLNKEIEDLNSKLNVLDAKLIEAEFTILKLKEEKSTTIQEKEMLKKELALLKRNSGVRRVEVGFPFLFVSLVALMGLTVGYLLHPQ